MWVYRERGLELADHTLGDLLGLKAGAGGTRSCTSGC